jgi:NAD(P)-dependent dehydrogenase (short-subunit alcohol dehydrogenase family)
MESSLAGRGGSANNALYASTKAGLVGFTRSLRAELAGTPVSASAICPSFIARDGMYARMQEDGVNAPFLLRAVAPERVAAAVLTAIVHDRPDMLVTGWPMRPLLALQEISPRITERAVAMTGAGRFSRPARRPGRPRRTGAAGAGGPHGNRPASRADAAAPVSSSASPATANTTVTSRLRLTVLSWLPSRL